MKTHNTKTTIGILVFIAIFSVIVVFSRTSGSEDKVFNDTPQEIIINSPVQVEPVKATPPLQETNEPQAVIKTEKEKPKPKKVSVIHTEYLSMQGQGIIGLYKSNLLDDPSDNIFTVKLDKGLSHKDIVYLNFDLTGVNDYTNIPYIINDRLAVGGYLVKHTETTSRQKLRINPGWLKKGENYIQFGLPENATFGYVVANLSIEVVKNEKPSVFVVNTSDVSYDGKAYLHGFVQSTHTEGTHFYINEEKIESQRGEFETLLSLSGNETISLRAVLPNGKEYKKTLTYNDNLIADNKYELNSLMEETSKLLKQGTPDILSLGSTSIEVDSSSLISPEKEIFLTSLRHIDVPAMDMGMSNTTAEYSGYRFLPHGEHFSDEGARVAIKYDRTKIPSGYTEDDIRTYYFDLETRHWAALELDSIDRENQMIISRTTHFTDMINGVIQVPESPETQGYAPTMMTDIKAADPSSKIQLISPPNANNRGSANLNYSFEMPPSRNGMSPNLAISYNSDGGSGWLGEGWDMNISSIKVDTRWGVPRYTSDYETETYLMDGNMLMTTNGRGNVTVSHREDTVLRIANRQFYLRQEGGFSQIIRKNSTTNSYYWEVIDKSGTKYTYGTNNGILRDPKTNNIAEWRLSKIVEVHGDSIEYHYREVDEPVVTGLTAKALYLDSVKVGIVGRAEPYTIVTFSSSTQKAKKVNNARYGFLTSSNRLLDSINISFENELLRRYTFTYEEGAFKTERLKSVTHKDSFGNDFASHDFDYYDDVASANGYDMFESRAEIWNLHEDNLDAGFVSPNIEFNGHGFSDKASALGGNKTSSYGVSLYSGVGAGYDPITISGTLGGSYSYNRGETSGISTLVDINGDGLPDKVFIKEKGIGFLKKDVLYYRPNISQSTDDYYKFGEEIEIVGIDKFSKTTSNTHTGGWNVSVGILIATAILGDDWSKSTAETSVYFSDVNNDGLIDIVSDKKVYFNHIEYDAQGRPVPTFTLQSSDTPNPILGGGPKRTEGAAVDSLEQNKIIKNSPMQDAVRFWEAPFDGKVEITGTFRQLPPPDTYVYERDGLCFSVQLEDSILFESAIYPNNLDIDSIDISEYYFVNKGDRIFFRVQSGWNKYANGYFDKVELNPVITYVGETNDIAPNGLSSTVYKSTESNVYTDNRYALMPAATPISVVGTFRKGITSDNLDLKINFMEAYIEVSGDNDTIYKYNPREIYSRHFAWNETFDGRLDIPSDLMANFYSPVENMTAGNNFQFLVHSDSNIAFDSVDWNPAIMQSYQVYDSIMMSYVNRDANIAAPVAYSVYASHNYKGIPFYSSILGDPTLNVQFSPMLKHYDEPTNFPLQHRHSQLVNGKFWILIKNQNGLVHKREINIVNNNIALNSDFVIPLPDAGTYWVEYYVTDEKILALIDKPDVGIITYRGSSPFQWISQKCYYAANVYSPRQENSFGPMYRGWGQFVYNAAGNRYALPIDTALLNKNNYLNEGDTINPLTVGFFPMTVVREDSTNLRYWKGADDNNYIKGNCFSASRLGMQDVIVTNPLEEAKKLSLKATDNSQAFRPNLKTESSSHVKLNSFGVLGISKSDSKGESKTKTAMMDINGDGYPDIIDQTGIQFTDIYGSLNGDFVRFREDTVFFISDNTSHGIAYSLSGEAVHSQVTSIRNIGKKSESRSSSEAKIALEIGVSSMAIPLPSGSYSTGGDEATNAWVDVNGDGLPDKIFNSKKVQLNLGYGFSDSIEWSIDTIQIGKNLSVNAGLGLSFGSSLSVGTGVAKTTSETNYILMDVNADGLPDKVMKRDRNIYVSLNMGNTFAAPEIWRRVNEISSSSSTSESFNGSFAVNVTFSFIKWSTRLGGGKATAMSRDNFALRDVDGDGYLEIVESHNDGTMSVYRSKIGRTNMLKTVKNPLGGSFTLDYERSRATYDHPGGKWTMSSVELNDGIFDDGPSVKNLFIYGNGKHDRREREFLGFEKVITQNINTESEDNEVYRELEKTYDVISVYTAGNEKASVVRDGQGNKYMETRNDYYLYRVSPSADNYQFNNHTSTSEPIIAYSPLKYTKTTVYEGETQGMTANEIFYNYHLNNHYGDLKTYTYSDKGNLGASGTGDYNYRTSIEYTHNPAKHILGLPNKVEVKDKSGNLYRRTQAEYDTNYPNHITKVIQTLDNVGSLAVTEFLYDSFGNIIEKTLPGEIDSERMVYSYTYDNKYHMYLTKISDSFHYESRITEYDYRYGIPLSSLDINGKPKATKIDNLGRVISVTGPKELVGQEPRDYTIMFDYSPTVTVNNGIITSPAYAITKHYDSEHPDDDIETVTFVDGFGRPIQVKKDAAITSTDGQTVETEDMMIVSGRVKYDSFGRAVESYYPTTDVFSNKHILKRSFDTVNPTLTEYDIMDRPVITTLPDGSQTVAKYTKNNSSRLQATTITDAMGGKQATFTNGSGLTIKTEQYSGPEGTITTGFEYDAINQLLKAIDTKGNETISTYDLAGRRTEVKHPASGTSRFYYDNASNLIARQSAELIEKDLFINYYYKYNRLDSIIYPENPQNNVRYYYGNQYADNNRKGRLNLLIDGTGAQEYSYGHMGEVTELKRTIVVPNQEIKTYTTKWVYDSFNRLLEMTYPDDETVFYYYNKGGLLDSVKGVKTQTYRYITHLGYDKFEQRNYMQYGNGLEGNGVETYYSYDPQLRRLSNLNISKGSLSYLENEYSYDSIGNVLSVFNYAAIPSDGIGGQTEHGYGYDGLYRLVSAWGAYTGINGKSAQYTLDMTYDNLHNVTSKTQDANQSGIQFDGFLQSGHIMSYEYNSDRPHQVQSIDDTTYRGDGYGSPDDVHNNHAYEYDLNGNLIYVNTGRLKEDGSQAEGSQERKLRWDEENRLMAISDNGYVSNYLYDASGERVVKSSGGNHGVFVNGVFSGGHTETSRYTTYISPYMVVSPGGAYTKHFYIGGERIVSKLCNEDNFLQTPNTTSCAGNGIINVDYVAQYEKTVQTIRDNYTHFGIPYLAEDKDPDCHCVYRNQPLSAPMAPNGNFDAEEEPYQYYYHADHLGSTSMITDADGNLHQRIEYIPFGEVFVEERYNNTWNTPFLFNAKELDEETGLYYYGARYYDPRTALWLSVDPMAEKYPGMSAYNYCMNNPVRLVDPDGKDVWEINGEGKVISRTKDKTRDAFYMVAKDTDGKYQRTYTTDLDGNINYNSISFEYGSITGSKKANWFRNATLITTDSESTGADLFKFFADNTRVEFGLINTMNDGSTVMTNHKSGSVRASATAKKMSEKGQIVTSIVHNHPNNSPPSGFRTGNTSGDKFAANLLINSHGYPVERYVYQPRTGSLIMYDEERIITSPMSWNMIFRPSDSRIRPAIRPYPGVGLPPP